MKLIAALVAVLPAVASQTVSQMLQGVPILGQAAPQNVISSFRSRTANNPAIARVWIRAAFHECGIARRSQVPIGGNTGSLQFESTRPENRGLEETIALYKVSAATFKISFAEAVHIGGIVALEALGGPTGMPMTVGRKDATGADAAVVIGPSAAAFSQIAGVMMTRMGFTQEEMVALIVGAHSVAFVNSANSPGLASGPLDITPNKFDSNIFANLLNANPAPGTTRLASDRNMALDSASAAIMRKSMANTTDFNIKFARAYYTMFNKGAKF